MVIRPRPHRFAFAAGGMAFLLFATVGTMVAFTLMVLGVAMPFVLAIAIVLLLQRRAVRRHYGYSFAPHPPPMHHPHYRQVPPPRPAPPRRVTWAQARDRFNSLRSAYARYECDPMLVLRLPALADVRVPSTGRFVEAFAEAQALETEHEPPAAHAASFVASVDRACRAWRAAWDAAERIRLSGLSPDERAAVDRIVKLLTVAKDSDSDAERHAAYARARAELARLERIGGLRLPRPAQAALDAAARGQLPKRQSA